ncbi:LysR family transcriptional regulator [Halopseudomonas oceani]|uniref:LysR family transcriptional regulator n=1 Tax=Halopseudomonas oceani TaxID=1708783 RepID=A0A2P4ES29_9GAMM|nr:LysR family transcriptional regulator [Halopseudomonas oceani]POB01783.1 LysR family transcriptional regulator [Halopseudomonas oceani]GGE54977.1 LysR family transcriptional regulator [Halopseudomonas oceani]
MSQLEDMQMFACVMEMGSFTAAADSLGLSKQLVSRRVAALEERLGVRLLNRSTRRLSATALGQAYLERVQRILQEVAEAEQLIGTQRSSPRGALRLSAPVSFGIQHLSPLLPGFLLRYPEVSVELDLSDRTIDLLAEGFDMAVRIGALADSSLIASPLMPLGMVTCASPAYLAARGVPQTPAELSGHECVLYGHSAAVEWPFRLAGRLQRVAVKGRYRINNGELVRDAAIAGLGIARLPTFIVEDALASGKLVAVLDAFQLPGNTAWAVYPQHRQASLLVRLLIDYLREALSTEGASAV